MIQINTNYFDPDEYPVAVHYVEKAINGKISGFVWYYDKDLKRPFRMNRITFLKRMVEGPEQ